VSQLLKNKIVALLIGFVFVLVLSYSLAISKTLDIRKQYKTLKNEESQFNNLSQQLSMLHKKDAHLDSILASLNLGNTSIENNLLRVVNQETDKNDLKVMDFDPPHTYQMDGTTYKTFNFVLRGNFTDILKTIHTLEMKSSFGEVAHIEFIKQKNYRTSKYFLEATILIQKIE